MVWPRCFYSRMVDKSCETPSYFYTPLTGRRGDNDESVIRDVDMKGTDGDRKQWAGIGW